MLTAIWLALGYQLVRTRRLDSAGERWSVSRRQLGAFMISSKMRVAVLAAAVTAVAALGLAANARAADECDKITEALKGMVAKIDDKAAKTDAGKCAAYSHLLGLMRIMRVVREECLSDGEKRINELAEGDTAIRGLATATDIQCQ